MKHSDTEAGASDWGRGTGKSLLSYRNQDLLREEEGGGKSGDRAEMPPRAVPRPHDLRSPSATDAKGKDTAVFDRMLAAPHARAWHELDPAQVRYRATTVPAVLLSKGERQAAGRDAALEWDEAKRTYRARRVASHQPRGSTGGNAEGGAGGAKGSRPPAFQTGVGQQFD